ncbi:heterokaryon incompatibility protein-domain-containing protein [Pyrenochaeta sp. MPI-SDFR-AT-0127]|nr:heterokaryon incompatibility protein-domain-containing protein [Pyrenochaeta sp. MPI-SDFR-AT-0127]
MEHFDMYSDSCPAYRAISYTWGDPSQVRKITLNGCPFAVRKNLWDFLDAVRNDPNRWYWIDAICIDQSNVKERNHQVNQMGEIYHNASETVVWLGNNTLYSSIAFDFIRRRVRENIVSFNLQEHVDSLSALWSTSYWQRIWVIQEIMLSGKLLVKWGQEEIEWTTVAFFVELMQETERQYQDTFSRPWPTKPFMPQHVESIFNQKDHWGHGRDWAPYRRSLSRVLEIYTSLECEDVRDKVYGLLGLVHVGAAIGVDYSKSTLDVYLDVLQQVATCEWDRSIDDHLNFGETLRRSMRLDEVEPDLLKKFMTPSTYESLYSDPSKERRGKMIWRTCDHMETIASMAHHLRNCKEDDRDKALRS